jgi:hypothetical protein
MLWLLVTANVVPSPPILVTLTIEAIRSSEMSVLTASTQRNIPQDGILHVHNMIVRSILQICASEEDSKVQK